MIRVLITIKGTATLSALGPTLLPYASRTHGRLKQKHLLLINVLTLEIRLTSFPLTLAASSLEPPNAGSIGVLPHPTESVHPDQLALLPIAYDCTPGQATGSVGGDVLRARKRSSERIAIALTRRMETNRVQQITFLSGEKEAVLTVEEISEAKEHHCTEQLGK